ncbi:hypothetical protein C8Q74DRAFT_1263810 [Fomes fomentarius]|nr:hypothetical protein C8Q74DRAFT_1263810 [Fomes fomentarius]
MCSRTCDQFLILVLHFDLLNASILGMVCIGTRTRYSCHSEDVRCIPLPLRMPLVRPVPGDQCRVSTHHRSQDACLTVFACPSQPLFVGVWSKKMENNCKLCGWCYQ